MSGYANSILGGASKLIRAAIQSPNYIPGTTGWTVNKDGSAEFNNLSIRGTFFGLTYIINSSGAFFYSGTPALGNLVISIATSAGTDSFGNAYKADVGVYSPDGTFIELIAGTPASVFIGSGDSAEATPAQFLTQVSGAGVTRKIATTLRAPRVSGENAGAASSLVLISPSADLSQRTSVSLVASDDGVNFSTINMNQTGITAAGTTSVQLVSGTASITVTPTSITASPTVPFISNGGTPANPTIISTDTWNLLAPANGWANAGGGLAKLQYRLTPDNEVWLIGVINPAAFTSTVIGTLPAGYRPTGAAMEDSFEFHTAAGAGSGCFLRIATTGAISAVNGVTTMGAVGINTRIPLDTIS